MLLSEVSPFFGCFLQRMDRLNSSSLRGGMHSHAFVKCPKNRDCAWVRLEGQIFLGVSQNGEEDLRWEFAL